MTVSSDRYLSNYPTYDKNNTATLSSPNTTVDTYPLNLAFINKIMLLGDLYLWHGEYTNASIQYKYISEDGFRNIANTGDAGKYERFNVNYSQFAVSYDASQKLTKTNIDGWQSIWSRPTEDTNAQREWQWTLPFDKAFLPVNPFVDLFSNQGGKYLLTASQLAMDNWNNNNPTTSVQQIQNNNIPYDVRGQLTVQTINGQPVIVKPLYGYLDFNSLIPVNIAQKTGRWLIYRTTDMQLHYAEAACNDNQVKIAYGLVNVGINKIFNGYYPKSTPSGYSPTNYEQTFQAAPYDMDARSGGTQDYHTAWYKEVGSRTRANLQPLPITLYTNNDKIGMENAIIDEDGLELAYEGFRWGDLLRVALRRNDPAFLADKVYEKLLRDHNPNASAVRAKLMNQDNWYLPFKP